MELSCFERKCGSAGRDGVCNYLYLYLYLLMGVFAPRECVPYKNWTTVSDPNMPGPPLRIKCSVPVHSSHVG